MPRARTLGRRRAGRRLLIGLLWVACGAAAAPAHAVEPPTPRIEAERNEIDVGQVVRGESVRARFVLRNTGAAELRILRVKPG